MKRSSGFTLVELLVVIGILGLLMVVLLQTISSGQATGSEAACRFRMGSIYTAIQNYKASKQKLPPGGGTEFLYRVWKFLGPSKQHRDMFFCTEVQQDAGGREDLTTQDVREIWRTKDDFDNSSTDYAFRAKQYRKNMMKGTEVILADDNEGGSNHARGTVNVMFGDGRTEGLFRDDLVEKQIWDEEDPDFFLIVGPESQHPDLRKLSIH